MTVLEVIQKSADFLRRRSVESARLNAEHLLARVLGAGRMELYLMFDRPMAESELESMRSLVVRRGGGEPLQHILGTVEFHGREFLCDARALVPRPETERLVERTLERLVERARAGATPVSRAADIGTGSGVIALTLALEMPAAEVWATDISEDAMALARENAGRLGVGGRVRFALGHLLDPLEGAFDLLVANLPYIATEELETLPVEVRRDPRLALDGGEGGLRLIGDLVREAPRHLVPGGAVALELGLRQAAEVRKMLEDAGWSDVEVERDYGGIERFVFASHG